MIDPDPVPDIFKNIPFWFALQYAIDADANSTRMSANRYGVNTYRGVICGEYIESGSYFPNHRKNDGWGKGLGVGFTFSNKFRVSMRWDDDEIHWYSQEYMDDRGHKVEGLSHLIMYPHSYKTDYECFVDPALVKMSVFMFNGYTYEEAIDDLIVLRLKMEP